MSLRVGARCTSRGLVRAAGFPTPPTRGSALARVSRGRGWRPAGARSPGRVRQSRRSVARSCRINSSKDNTSAAGGIAATSRAIGVGVAWTTLNATEIGRTPTPESMDRSPAALRRWRAPRTGRRPRWSRRRPAATTTPAGGHALLGGEGNATRPRTSRIRRVRGRGLRGWCRGRSACQHAEASAAATPPSHISSCLVGDCRSRYWRTFRSELFSGSALQRDTHTSYLGEVDFHRRELRDVGV